MEVWEKLFGFVQVKSDEMWRIILSEAVRSVLAESPTWTVRGAVRWGFVVQMGKPRPAANEKLDWRSPASGLKSPDWLLVLCCS